MKLRLNIGSRSRSCSFLAEFGLLYCISGKLAVQYALLSTCLVESFTFGQVKKVVSLSDVLSRGNRARADDPLCLRGLLDFSDQTIFLACQMTDPVKS